MREDIIKDVTVVVPVVSRTTANATKQKYSALGFVNVQAVRIVSKIFQVVFQMGMLLSNILLELELHIDRL